MQFDSHVDSVFSPFWDLDHRGDVCGAAKVGVDPIPSIATRGEQCDMI